MAPPVGLTSTSYVVLGLVATMQPVTSYDMKRRVALSIGNFWPFPHSQLYAEPARLAAAGLLDETVEAGGRRRRHYTITAAGKRGLQRWLADPVTEHTEVRDLALLKLFFGSQSNAAQRRALAEQQVRMHQERLDGYEAARQDHPGFNDEWGLHTLEMGKRFERAMVAFWRELAPDDVDGLEADGG
ncbi:MAG TPA: PadR family transcriptional regulator [Acidimicrobiales bacterium]